MARPDVTAAAEHQVGEAAQLRKELRFGKTRRFAFGVRFLKDRQTGSLARIDPLFQAPDRALPSHFTISIWLKRGSQISVQEEVSMEEATDKFTSPNCD